MCINPAAAGAELLAALNLTVRRPFLLPFPPTRKLTYPSLQSCSHLIIPPTLRKTDRLPLLKSLLTTLSTGESTSTHLSDPACPSLKEIIVVDNTFLGAKGFGDFLEAEGMERASDFRTCFEWEGEGVPGAEKCDIQDGEFGSEGEVEMITDVGNEWFAVVNIQFTSGTTGQPKGFVPKSTAQVFLAQI